MTSFKKRIELILDELRNGRMIILTDHADRENEGDLVFPAESVTPEKINFMIRNGSGIICLSLMSEHLKKLNINLMVPTEKNESQRTTPFTVSIEAKKGVTTGVSSADRAHTILTAISDSVTPNDIVTPGHIFPLQAKNGGVLEREGHTEGAIDLVRLAGFKPAAVICELMNSDGTMMHGDSLKSFAEKNKINIVSIEELINYRLLNEDLIQEEIQTELPLEKYGKFNLIVIKEKYTHHEQIVLSKESIDPSSPMLIRIHSSCITGDLFGSLRCDCRPQLHYCLERIAKEGGMLFYLSQEGRGIGLFNKIKAYALQEKGFDTVDANLELKLAIDAREYYIAANFLRKKQISRIKLLTNNPNKTYALCKYGIDVVTSETIPIFSNEHNKKYLLTKRNKLQHAIDAIL